MFISVTALPRWSVTVGAPDASEPPAIETFALVAVSETRWNSGVAAGKSLFALTDSSTPLTESTAEAGAVGVEPGPGGTAPPPCEDAGGFFGDDTDEPDEDDEPAGAPEVACCWNGSLLVKSVKLVSCPSSGVGERSALTTRTSE